MNKKQKLELSWIGKDERPYLEPRILVEDSTKSYHASQRVGEDDIFDNRLIFGDNLLALKALEAEFTGRVKCVFIDPPYNTGSAFEHYDDGVEHSIWLSLIRDRLEIIRRLLAPDGSLWIAIDDNEGHYLKVLCDEVFGRSAFVASMVWENFYGRSNAAAISPAHNYILLYSPMGQDWKKVRNLLPRGEESANKYKNQDNDPRGPWRLGPIFAAGERHDGLMYTITTPSGRKVSPPKGSHWRMLEEQFWKMVDEGRIVFGEKGDNNPAVKLFLSEVQGGLVPRTWWPHTEVGHSQEAKREIQALFPDEIPFDTPKPERLLFQILTIATNPGDIVLDSFAGSGTTGAVAHKMGRRWIMIELGPHCDTYVAPRLKKVIDGADDGGVTAASGWKSGGGFRYFRLAPSLLEKDKWGNWVIQSDYNPTMLAEAVCKLMGFTYAPSEQLYWMHGYSSERDFIYVTTQSLTRDQLRAISEEVGDDRSLLVCCKAFNAKPDAFLNLTIKKIPLAVPLVRDYLVLSTTADEGEAPHPETMERLLSVPAHDAGPATAVPITDLDTIETGRRADLLALAEAENDAWLEEESEKLDAYADDLERAFEAEIKAIEIEIKAAKKALRGSNLVMSEKLAEKRRISAQEAKRDKMKAAFFDRKAEIRAEVESMLDKIQETLKLSPELTPLFTVRWEVA